MNAVLLKSCEAIVTSADEPVRWRQDILCRNGAIAAIGPNLSRDTTEGTEVIDATGRLHMQKQVPAGPGQVLLPNSNLNTGVWFVRITNNGEQKSYRVPLVR